MDVNASTSTIPSEDTPVTNEASTAPVETDLEHPVTNGAGTAAAESNLEQPVTNGGGAGPVKTDLEQRIIFQMEYYFSDCNVLKDKFLKQKMEENEGWVPLNLFEKFPRMAKISTDVPVIANALRKSERRLLQISEDGLSVRRNPEIEIPKDMANWVENSRARTVFVGGFPTDGSVKMDDILDYLYSFCKYEGVVMRVHPKTRAFKGSVLVIFSTVEEAEKFIEREIPQFRDITLFRESQHKHFENKSKKIEEKNNKRRKDREERDQKFNTPLPKGALICVSGIPIGTARGDLVKFLIEKGLNEYAFIEFNDNEEQAYIRLKNENSADATITEVFGDQPVTFKDSTLTVGTVTGEEEENKLKEMLQAKVIHNRQYASKFKGGGKRFKKNRN